MSNRGFYENYLSTEAQRVGSVDVISGGSGYFSAPSQTLDPHLFDGDHLKDDVRRFLLDAFTVFFSTKYKGVTQWSTLWLAGSGISYQWEADRGNGDLDVLVGVEFDKFFAANPEFHGIPEPDMAEIFNSWLRADLWPRTASKSLNGHAYEVTFYVNPGGSDIRHIRPYAAYDITHDEWTVRPPVLPQDPSTLYDKTWWEQVERETSGAKSLVDIYNRTIGHLSSLDPKSADYRREQSRLDLIVDQAHQMFDDIHLGRRDAFSQGGGGYGDWANFRWQAHKKAGTVQALNQISSSRKRALEAQQTDQYGAPIKDAHAALNEAAMWGKHLRGMS